SWKQRGLRYVGYSPGGQYLENPKEHLQRKPRPFQYQLTPQAILALHKKYDDAFDNGDAVALAALYTEYGAFVIPHNGVKHGREAIAEHCAIIEFQFWHANNLAKTVDRVIAVGNEIRVLGRWNCAFKDDA